jgi:hypothetical protein
MAESWVVLIGHSNDLRRPVVEGTTCLAYHVDGHSLHLGEAGVTWQPTHRVGDVLRAGGWKGGCGDTWQCGMVRGGRISCVVHPLGAALQRQCAAQALHRLATLCRTGHMRYTWARTLHTPLLPPPATAHQLPMAYSGGAQVLHTGGAQRSVCTTCLSSPACTTHSQTCTGHPPPFLPSLPPPSHPREFVQQDALVHPHAARGHPRPTAQAGRQWGRPSPPAAPHGSAAAEGGAQDVDGHHHHALISQDGALVHRHLLPGAGAPVE